MTLIGPEFDFISSEINHSLLKTKSLKRVYDSVDGSDEEYSIEDLLEKYKDCGINKISSLMGNRFSIESDVGEIKLEGQLWLQQLLEIFLPQLSLGRYPFQLQWFYYESNEVKDDDHTHHYFFLVHKGEIVEERARLSFCLPSSKLPEDILSKRTPDDFTWKNDWDHYEAYSKWCYLKFYETTTTGQTLRFRKASAKPIRLYLQKLLQENHVTKC